MQKCRGEGVLGGNFAWKASATYFPHPVLVPISTAGSGDNFAEVSMALNDAECPTLVAQRQGENHVGWAAPFISCTPVTVARQLASHRPHESTLVPSHRLRAYIRTSER